MSVMGDMTPFQWVMTGVTALIGLGFLLCAIFSGGSGGGGG